jgi:hypothetical protein
MHVRMAVAALLSLAACDRFDAAPAPSPRESAAPAASAPSPETHRLARRVADAALACAKSCVVWVPPFDDAQDECRPDEPSVKALEDAAAALAAHAKDHPAEVRGAAAAFAAEARLFADWVGRGVLLERTRGTLRLFQDFADAWNAYRPEEPIPVDPIEEYRLKGFGSKGYIMKPLDKTRGRVVWKSCYDGPCLWENHW